MLDWIYVIVIYETNVFILVIIHHSVMSLVRVTVISKHIYYKSSFYASGARISTVTDVGPGAVGERNVADLRELTEWPLLALEPRRHPEI